MKMAFVGVLGGLQSLAHDEAHEKPVDRLGAVAAASSAQIGRAQQAERTAALCSLGVELLRFKFSKVASARLDAEDKLAIALETRRVKLSRSERTRVARWAIQEWASDLCPPRPDGCGGAKEVPAHDVEHLEGHQPMRSCPVCRGTGRRRYTDQERIQAMGKPFDAAMDEAHALINWAESLAVQFGKKQLERY